MNNYYRFHRAGCIIGHQREETISDRSHMYNFECTAIFSKIIYFLYRCTDILYFRPCRRASKVRDHSGEAIYFNTPLWVLILFHVTYNKVIVLYLIFTFPAHIVWLCKKVPWAQRICSVLFSIGCDFLFFEISRVKILEKYFALKVKLLSFSKQCDTSLQRAV